MDLTLLVFRVRCPLAFHRAGASLLPKGGVPAPVPSGEGRQGQASHVAVCSALPSQPSILETCALIMKIICLEIYYVVK